MVAAVVVVVVADYGGVAAVLAVEIVDYSCILDWIDNCSSDDSDRSFGRTCWRNNYRPEPLLERSMQEQQEEVGGHHRRLLVKEAVVIQ